jgi:UDP-N-acetylglucosamine--N-acetylmuramyl-(pentapeptide) pyrophosphoryl-undecaprenol N-acetylglucosamine transferase
MNFAIAAGGTGGHLFPGLAVGEVLLALGHRVMLIVSEKEIDTVATQGRSEFQIEKVPGIGLQGKSPVALLNFALKFHAGLRQCRTLFAAFQPRAVLGMGGFTSLAPILAGRKRKVPTFVHDSNAIPGKANKLNARFCSAVLLGFEECAAHFPKSRCIVTGTPVRSSLVQRVERTKALGLFGLSAERKTLLVMGGSQGAHGLNLALTHALPALRDAGIQIIHLTGRQDEDRMRAAYAEAGVPASVAAFYHRMEEAYSAADFAIARSGAASLTELSHFALPSILIPYPFAAEDHQTLNAKIFERAGAAVLLPERDATGEVLAQKIRWCLAEPARLSEMSARSAALAPREAAERVAEVILSHTKP